MCNGNKMIAISAMPSTRRGMWYMRRPGTGIICGCIIGILVSSMMPTVGADYDESTIIGVCYDTNDDPRVNAMMTAYNSRTEEFITTYTDEEGLFELDLDDLPSGYLIDDEIALFGLDGDVKFWNSLYDLTQAGNFLVVNDGLDRIVSGSTPTVYWGNPQYEGGQGDYTEEEGQNWGIIAWDSPLGPEYVKDPELVIRKNGQWVVSIDMRFEDDVLDDPNVDDYKILFNFWVSTVPSTQWQPSPKTAQAPNAVRSAQWDDTYLWSDVPYDTGWMELEVDLDPPNGNIDWYGNAEMISYHWNDQTHDWDFYQHALFWEQYPVWETMRGI
jgi:hypothetical protein